MTDKVHGGDRGGEFLTGKMDFFTIRTVEAVDQTNVDTPSSNLYQISASVWTPVTITDGHGVAVTYSSKANYDTAYDKQQELNGIIKTFAIRANPVMVSVSVESVSNPYTTFGFGSSYNSTRNVTTINIASEKSGAWLVNVADTNDAGYGLDAALEAYGYAIGGTGQNIIVERRVAL
jgi:hypothetical protein